MITLNNFAVFSDNKRILEIFENKLKEFGIKDNCSHNKKHISCNYIVIYNDNIYSYQSHQGVSSKFIFTLPDQWGDAVDYLKEVTNTKHDENNIIQITKIIPPTFDLYTPDNNYLGNINEYEFLDIRVKIKQEQIFGYYVIFNGKKVRIDKNGELDEYPNGLLDTMSKFYAQLI